MMYNCTTAKSRNEKAARAVYAMQGKALLDLADSELPAVVEVQSRLAALYPEYAIAHLPSDAIQCTSGRASELSTEGLHVQVQQHHCSVRTDPMCSGGAPESLQHPVTEDEEQGHTAVDCNQFVANAAVYGDCYQWHLDADPSGVPQTLFTPPLLPA